MPRRPRIHVPHSFYYVSHRSSRGQSIFSGAADYALFERLLTEVLARCEARVHGYYWQPGEIHLIVQISEVPLSSIMQRLTGNYSRIVNRRNGESGTLFEAHHRALLLEPQTCLAGLVRYLHYLPVLQGIAQLPGDCATSSHNAYLGSSIAPWLRTSTLLRLLGPAARNAPDPYGDLMRRPPTEEDICSFTSGSPCDSRVLGSAEFLSLLPRSMRVYRSTASLTSIAAAVILALGVERQEVFSRSSTRSAALARAAIAWHAVERRVATITEVARFLGRHPSSLSSGIARHRKLHPDLFNHAALRHARPLLPG